MREKNVYLTKKVVRNMKKDIWETEFQKQLSIVNDQVKSGKLRHKDGTMYSRADRRGEAETRALAEIKRKVKGGK